MSRPATEPILAELSDIQRSAGRGTQNAQDLERARALIGHEDNTVRWQALIAVGEWIRKQPEAVWEVVLEHGESEDDDMRAGVACVLLEHLLEHHYRTYFPLLRKRIEAGALRLADTLGMCWFDGANEPWSEVHQLVLWATDGEFRIGGERYKRIPHDGAADTSAPDSSQCRVCGVGIGDLHDTACASERCPACGEGAWTCGCSHDD